MQQEFSITLDWREGYEFSVDFEQEGVPDLLTDEPPPLGEGGGPNPARLLAAAVGNCMSASLKFCLDRAHLELEDLKTTVDGTIVRNERGRLRIGSLRVRLEPTLDPADLSNGSVNVTVNTKSINTLNEQRDDHLRTPDFFAADSFPTMTFRSTRVETAGNMLQVHGDLTLRGVTKPVVLDAVYLGQIAEDPWGQERVAFLATTEIDRHDFNVSFNQTLEEMTMIGDRVAIEIAIEAVRQ